MMPRALDRRTNIRPAQGHEAEALSALALKAKASWGYAADTIELWKQDLSISTDAITSRPTFVAAVGDEIVDLIQNNTSSFVVLCGSSTQVLTGNDNADFSLDVLSGEAGAIPFTAQKIGAAMYLDNRGLRSITTTQAYGDFLLGTLTPQVQRFLHQKRAGGHSPVGSTIVRTKDHYRVFFSDMSGVSVYMGRKNPEPMLFSIDRVLSCICSIEDGDGTENVDGAGMFAKSG